MIYLDNAATTKVSNNVFDDVFYAMYECYGNPSSLHQAGTNAKKIVQTAREKIAKCIGAIPEEIIFTAGGSESDNLALRGIAPLLKQNERTTIITSQIEHHAVLNTCKELEKQGFRVIYMPVDQDGRVDIEELERVMRMNAESLGLVSIMAVNNEVGSVQLIDDIGDLCQEYNAYFMTDAVQALGHIPLDVNNSNIDLMAMSGHKINALKGVGALYVRSHTPLEHVITGGGQEFGLRAGTENVPGIASMGNAVELAYRNMDSNNAYYAHMRELFLDELNRLDVEYVVNCAGGVPNIISLTLPHCDSEAMLLLLNEKGICVSSGSACMAGSLEPSHVLKALYLSDQDANCTIRISMGNNNYLDELIQTAQEIASCTRQLKKMVKG